MTGRGRAPARMRVGILGEFGGGNIGNEASADIAIALLGARRSDAEFRVLTSFPTESRARHGVPARSLRPGVWPVRRVRPQALKVLLAGLLDALLLPYQWATVRSLSAIVVPGTGILDDFGEPWWGMPMALAKWAVLARLAGRPFHFVSVGAGPIVHPFSRLLFATAARLATSVSYRDGWSRAYAIETGFGRPEQRVTCDIVFGRDDVPDRESRVGRVPADAPLVVGVGVMAYGGWDGEAAGALYRRYVRTIGEVVDRLLAAGHEVRFLIGQPVDQPAVDDVVAACRSPRAGSLVRASIVDFDDLLAEVGRTDVVIATRYHNIVAALLMRRPVISLSYAAKNAELLAAFGWERFDQLADNADGDWVWERFGEVMAGPRTWGAAAEDVLAQWRRVTAAECDRLVGELTPAPTARPPRAAA